MLNRSDVHHDLAMQPLLHGAAWLEAIRPTITFHAVEGRRLAGGER